MHLTSQNIAKSSIPFIYANSGGDGVDKGTNRKTPGTSGEGPRPPRKNEFPDKESKKDKIENDEVDNLEKDRNEEKNKKS